MKFLEILQKEKIERLSILHELTKGFDKYLVMQLLNDYYDEIYNLLSSKYEIYEREEEDGFIYADKFYFNNYEYVCNKLYIHNSEIFFNIEYEELDKCWRFYDLIEILENILREKHLTAEEIEQFSNTVNPTKQNRNENIFANNGYILFTHILENYIKEKNTRGRYKDLSYFYRKLYNDKYIHQKPEPFRLWFIGSYDEEFSKLNTLIETKNAQREKDYSSSLHWFKEKI